MRKSTTEHNRTQRAILLAAVMALSALPAPPAGAGNDEFHITREDMVSIHADQAWEDVEPDTIHFSGHFEIRVRDWRISADSATLYGRLDDPDRMEMGGSPARLEVSYTQGGRLETVRGEAEEILYQRESATVLLNGSATLSQGENVLHSKAVEYDLNTNRFRTLGEAGLQIKLPTRD